MNFVRDTFAAQLGQNVGTSLSGNSWDQWQQTKGGLNQVVSYAYSGSDWRTWSPESSAMLTDLGMLVSCKIDFANGVGDDHIILIVGFLKVKNAAPTINFVEASIQFYDDTDLNISSGPIKSDPNNPSDVATLLYNALNSQVQAEVGSLGSGGTLQGRKSLPDIARIHVESMAGTVTA